MTDFQHNKHSSANLLAGQSSTFARIGIGVRDADQALEVVGIVHINGEQADTPAAPVNAEGGLFYTKADGKPYWRSYEVAETDLTSGGQTTEQIQDIVGAMFIENTETRVAVTYDDDGGKINVAVDDMTANTQLTQEQVEDFAGAMVASGGTKTGIAVTYQDNSSSAGTMDFVIQTLNQDTTGTAATVTGAAQAAITSLGTLTGLAIASSSSSAIPLVVTGDSGQSVDFLVVEADGGADYFSVNRYGAVVMGLAGNRSITTKEETGEDTAGKDLLLKAGKGTGDAAGGELGFYVSPAGGSSGEGSNAWVEAMAIASDKSTTMKGALTVDGSSSLKEQSAANADVGAYGQVWVKDSNPNELYFTTGDGGDIQITSGTSLAGVSLSGSANNTVATVTGSNALIGEANLTFDGNSLLVVTGSASLIPCTIRGASDQTADILVVEAHGGADYLNVNHIGSVVMGLAGTRSITTREETGENTAGKDLLFKAGKGTGNAAGGELGFYVSPADVSGESTNAWVEAMAIASDKSTTMKGALTVDGAASLKEQSAADADVGDYGQMWVKTATPNQLWFTNDIGNDIQITSGAALSGSSGEANEYSFKTITFGGSASAQSDVVADADDDTLTLVAGANVTITTTADQITFVATDTNTTYSPGTLLDVSGTTFNVDLTEAAEAVMAHGDYVLFLDGGATGSHAKEAIADVATLFAGSGLTATNSVIAVDNPLNQNTTGTAATVTGAAQTAITSLGTLTGLAIASGSSSAIPLTVTGDSGQSVDLLVVEANGGADYVSVNPAGNIVMGLSGGRSVQTKEETGTDTDGKDLLLKAGKGTGTGEGGDLGFYVSPAAVGSGTGNNDWVEAMAITTDGSVVMGLAGTRSLSTRTETGTDTAGKDLLLRAGKGTGTGAGGDLRFYTAPAAVDSGTGSNAWVEAMIIESDRTTTMKGALTVDGASSLKEQSSADADVADYGQMWVKTASPNQLYFTNDVGDDIQITSGDALVGGSGGGLSEEQVQDIVGAMFEDNTETRIVATYEDSDGTIDLVVTDMTADTNTWRTVTAGGNTLSVSETLAFTAGTGISIAESAGAVTITNTVSDTNTTYSAGTLLDLSTTTFNVDLTEAAEAVMANGDYILFLDGGATGSHAKEAIADVATLFAGSGLTATNSVIAVNNPLNQDTTGTAATVTGAAQAAITSVGTLTGLAVASGSSSAIPLVVTGDSGQSVDFLVVEANGGADYFSVNSIGAVVMGLAGNKSITTKEESGTDTDGQSLFLKGGKGTGTGPGGDLKFYTSPKGGSTGDSTNAWIEAMAIVPEGSIAMGLEGTRSITTREETGTNTAGKDLLFKAGKGTGSGAGGDLGFYVSPAGGGGTSTNPWVEAMAIAPDKTTTMKGALTVDGSASLKEQSAANADVGAYGQMWVKTASPNQLWFTTDVGNDIQITSGDALSVTDTNTWRTVTAGGNTLSVSETLAFTAGTGISIAESAGAVTITNTVSDTNTFRTVTAGGNTLGSGETLAFTAGTGVSIAESAGAVTITNTVSDTNTTYSPGDGLDLSGTTFSTDLKSNGGLVIESTELAVDLGASSVTGTLAVGDGGSGQTSYTNGQLLIGNTTGNTLAKATLTAGTGISITNGSGSVTIANTVTDTNTWRTVTAGGNTLSTSETLAFTAGTGITIAESAGAVTITNSVSGGISHDGSTANGVLTYKDADEATVEANMTFDGNSLAVTTSSASAIPCTIKAAGSQLVDLLLIENSSSASLVAVEKDGTIELGGSGTGQIKRENVSGTDVAGKILDLRGGKSTGDELGGEIRFLTSPAGSSGAGVNNSAEALVIDGNKVVDFKKAAATDGGSEYAYASKVLEIKVAGSQYFLPLYEAAGGGGPGGP